MLRSKTHERTQTYKNTDALPFSAVFRGIAHTVEFNQREDESYFHIFARASRDSDARQSEIFLGANGILSWERGERSLATGMFDAPRTGKNLLRHK